jgi:hypothetical protein
MGVDTSAIHQAIDGVMEQVRALAAGHEMVGRPMQRVGPLGEEVNVPTDHTAAIAERTRAVETFLTTAHEKVDALATHLDRIVDP